MARRIAVEIVGDASSLERAFKRSAKSAQQFNGDIAKAGKGRKALDGLKSSAGGMAAGFIGVGAITAGIQKSISASSDLNEEIAKNKVVFKDSSGTLEDWSKTTANAMGVSQAEALKATGTMGNMLVPMGFARDKAADMSKSMVNLAGDMASFNNASPEEVLDAINLGLRGESEPLSRFGVLLNDARLKEEAMRQGLYKGKGALDANAKAQATYALLLKDTKDAQGDAARTGDSWAGVQRRLKALVEDLSAKLGDTLVPALAAAANTVADWLSKTENQQAIMDGLRSVVEVVSTAVGILKTAWEALTTVLGGNRNAIIALVAAYATFKAAQITSSVVGLAASFGGLTGKVKGSAAATRGLSKSMVGKAGLVGAAGAASFALTTMLLKATGLDQKLRELGASAYDAAAKIGLVNDPMAQFEGTKAPSQAAAGKIRRQAQKMVAGGMTPQQAANVIAPRHPGMAKRDVEVLAGAKGSTFNIGTINTGAKNARELEEDIHKRARTRPQRRR